MGLGVHEEKDLSDSRTKALDTIESGGIMMCECKPAGLSMAFNPP